MGPLDNPGILSEINLSPWSCRACHYDVVLALSQWQFVQCFPSSPYYSAVQRSLPSIHLCLPVWLSLSVNQLSTLSCTVVLLSRWPAQEQVADEQNKCSVARTSVTSLNPLIRCWDISLKNIWPAGGARRKVRRSLKSFEFNLSGLNICTTFHRNWS